MATMESANRFLLRPSPHSTLNEGGRSRLPYASWESGRDGDVEASDEALAFPARLFSAFPRFCGEGVGMAS
jgi:hypothetical protein